MQDNIHIPGDIIFWKGRPFIENAFHEAADDGNSAYRNIIDANERWQCRSGSVQGTVTNA